MGEELLERDFTGRYVCFGRPDGTFCWGRIERETVWNTKSGPRPAFVLSGMVTCSLPMGNSSAVGITPQGPQVVNVFSGNATSIRNKLGVRHHPGERLVIKDQLDLEKDIFDWKVMDDDQLFLLVLRTKLSAMPGLPPAIENMVRQGMDELPDNVEQDIATELKERVGITE
jgi:hypothetical protein